MYHISILKPETLDFGEVGIMNTNLLKLTCGCICAFAATGNAAYSPQVGQLHPDFILPSINDGRPVSLSQFRGKKVLLVHFSSW